MIENGRWIFYIVPGVMVAFSFLCGTLAIAKGLKRTRQAKRLATVGERATALVVDNQEESHSEGRTQYRPVVTFRTTAGAEVRTVLEDAAATRSHLTQKPVDVLYDPADPNSVVSADAKTADFRGSLTLGLIFIGFGILVLIVTQTALANIDMS